MNKKRPLISLLVCLLLGMACGLPALAPTVPPPSDLIGTAVAQTVTAAARLNPPVPVSATPQSRAVLLTVSQATNCRTGPGTDYERVGLLEVGETAEATGRYSPGNYWIIKTPRGSGVCWLWGQYASVVSGDPASLPEILPPPSPTPQPLTVTSVRAFVPAEPWQGTCPHTFRVWAEVTLSGQQSDTLVYRWKRSDGFVGPEHSLAVGAGTYTLEGEWKVTRDGSYRIQVEILSPTALVSGWSNIHEVDCR